MEDETAYRLLIKGRRLLEEGYPAQAAIILERARDEVPGKGSILELLGRAYYGYGRYRDAAERFEEAIEVDPTNDYAHYCLGLCFCKLNREEDAKTHFKLAWYLRPGDQYRSKAVRYGLAGSHLSDAPDTAGREGPEGMGNT